MSELFKFQRGVHTKVVVPDVDVDVDLEVVCLKDDDVLEFYLDGKKVFSGDWSGNFRKLFEILLEEMGKEV
jgi:hypothetical protein